ncbi:MAG TPA: peptidoglycan-associated lipoprotein Pal [bacterium]|nr:peptidoglycan-associated lipoprotein Pal [bacterium]
MRMLRGLVIVLIASVFWGCGRRTARIDETLMEQPAVSPEPARERPVEPAPVKPPADRPVRELVFENVHFGFDRHDLTDTAREILTRHARTLRENPQVRIRVEGHCDERGTIEYNLALGERRANSVRMYLINLGVDASRITTISYGKERPLDTRHNEEAWARNRRAGFVIVK